MAKTTGNQDGGEGAHDTGAALGMAFQIAVRADGQGRRFTYVAPSCFALNGVTAEAALADGDVLYGLILPEHLAQVAQAEARALETFQPFDIEVPFRNPDGVVRWRRLTSAPRRLEDGSTLWDGVQIDIHQRKLLELELERERRRLGVAIDATGLGLWEWRPREGTLTWSRRNKDLFGLPPEADVTIADFSAAVHPEDRERVIQSYRDARERPDGSDFSFEYRVRLADGQTRWILAHARVFKDEAGPHLIVGTSLDVTERREEEERRALVMGELAHRAKNGIAIVMALVSQTARGASSVEQFEESLNARLQSMADSQDLVTAARGKAVDVEALIVKALTPFGLARFEIDPALREVKLTTETPIGIALLLHEMGTNATKYGALSNSRGRVKIRRLESEPGRAVVAWREVDGPRVANPDRTGFGTRLLQAALRNQGGKVESTFAPDGFQATLEFPTA